MLFPSNKMNVDNIFTAIEMPGSNYMDWGGVTLSWPLLLPLY